MATVGNSLTRSAGTNLTSGAGVLAMYIPSFPASGSVTAVRFNIEDTGGTGDTYQAAIYSGNTRLGLSTARTDISTEGTYEFTFGTPVAVTSGQPYRFAIGTNSAAGSTLGLGTGTYVQSYSNGSTGVPPASPNSGGWGDTGSMASAEVEYTTGGSSAAPLAAAYYAMRRN
jgi:hypothetical protein